MIDKQRKLLFIHIPKTGGTSVTTALAGDKAVRSHLTLRHYQPVTPAELCRYARRREGGGREALGILKDRYRQFLTDRRKIGLIDEDYLVFAVVRNPWARIASWYKDTLRNPTRRNRLNVPADITLRGFLERFGHKWQLRPQMHWLTGWDGGMGVDEVLYFERLSEQWPAFAARTGLPLELPTVNAAPASYDWRACYDEDSYRFVAQICRDEIERFGYRFE